jgi:hypothetical protein
VISYEYDTRIINSIHYSLFKEKPSVIDEMMCKRCTPSLPSGSGLFKDILRDSLYRENLPSYLGLVVSIECDRRILLR